MPDKHPIESYISAKSTAEKRRHEAVAIDAYIESESIAKSAYDKLTPDQKKNLR